MGVDFVMFGLTGVCLTGICFTIFGVTGVGFTIFGVIGVDFVMFTLGFRGSVSAKANVGKTDKTLHSKNEINTSPLILNCYTASFNDIRFLGSFTL